MRPQAAETEYEARRLAAAFFLNGTAGPHKSVKGLKMLPLRFKSNLKWGVRMDGYFLLAVFCS